MDFIAFNYLGNIFDVANLLAMLLGVLVGLVIGAIPGLSPPMAIALMIPVSFQFPPETALICWCPVLRQEYMVAHSPLFY